MTISQSPVSLIALSGLALLGIAPHVHALTAEERLQKLEALVERQQRRLDDVEAENARLKAERPTAPETPTPHFKALDQKVKLIERKLEVDKETAEANAAKQIKAELGTQGLKMESPDGSFKLWLRGTVQADSRFFLDDHQGDVNNPSGDSLNDQFVLRRVRPILEGTLFRYFDYRIMPDFASGSARLFDAYVDARYIREASLTVGKFKAPVSLERLQSASALFLIERAYPTQLAPNRDVGIMLHGEFDRPGFPQAQRSFPLYNFPEFFAYQVGVFNGSPNNGNIDGDTNDGKEFAGRLFAHPFLHSGIGALEGLGLGVAGTYGEPNDERLASYTTPGQNTMFSYAAAARGDGVRTRIYPQLYWNWGNFGLLGEYVIAEQALANQSVKNRQTVNSFEETVRDTAWNLTASYILTGEQNVFLGQGLRPRHPFDPLYGVRPERPFDPFEGDWGAFQVVGRVTEIDFDNDVFANVGTASKPIYALADPRSAVSRAFSWALGINWWLNTNFKVMANYEETHFTGGAGVFSAAGTLTPAIRDRETEKVFMTRFQAAF